MLRKASRTSGGSKTALTMTGTPCHRFWCRDSLIMPHFVEKSSVSYCSLSTYNIWLNDLLEFGGECLTKY